jgi:hypothetical protein
MYQVVPVMYREGLLVPEVQIEGFQEGQRFELLVPSEKGVPPFLIEEESGFQASEGVSVAEASSGIVGLQSSELIQEIAMDPALSLWSEGA